METSKKILLAEDRRTLADALYRLLMKSGYRVEIAYDGAQALLRLTEETFDLVLTETDLPGIGGEELMKIMEKKDIHIPVIALSDRKTEGQFNEVVEKPFCGEYLLRIIESLFEQAVHLTAPGLCYAGGFLLFGDNFIKATVSEIRVLRSVDSNGKITFGEMRTALFTGDPLVMRKTVFSINEKLKKISYTKKFYGNDTGYLLE